MKRFGLLALLAMVLSLALAACGGSPAADSAGTGTAAQPTAAPTVTPEEMPEEEDPLLAAPVGNGGYDSCLDPWDYGRVQEAYQSRASHTGYAATLILTTRTRDAGPADFDECWRNKYGDYVFLKHDVPITKDAFDRLKGNRNDLTILAPAYWAEVPVGWETAVWVHDWFNSMSAEDVQELVNTYGHALVIVGSLAATGLLISSVIPPVFGSPLVPDCPENSCG